MRRNRRQNGGKRKKSTEKVCVVQEISLKEKEERQELRLGFSQRKDRFLVVATVIGFLVVVWKFWVKMSIDFVARFPVKSVNLLGVDNFFLTYEQIISIIYVVTIAMIIVCFLGYCAFELYSFQQNENTIFAEGQADKMYALVFEVAFILMVTDTFISVLTLMFFSELVVVVLMLGFVLVTLIILIIVIVKDICKQKRTYKEKSVKKHYISKFFSVSGIKLLFSVFIFAMLYVMVYNNAGNLVVHYNNQNIVLRYESAHYPKEIKCIVENEEGCSEIICPFDSYGESSFVERIYYNNYGESSDFNKNYYCYVYDIDISKWCEKGLNVIRLEFSINDVEYHIHNTLRYNKTYSYTENEIVIDL